ncbi:hypothetical protein CONLIGDRAFT_76249 [Coniochaeta ligniaria NRRL 30616]|uniref:Uncharacterized protein n=1 Tax=Coniochaeta ligniaria NRRL 30616 TaxID=1408157 RepID=A0A1J7IB67_9PEZI|nr:hypothetical protein CONLIGDRAFT_76249 [Coniochaeta ligniaria NRRL 30616]
MIPYPHSPQQIAAAFSMRLQSNAPETRFPIRSPHHPRSLADFDVNHAFIARHHPVHGTDTPFGQHTSHYDISNHIPRQRPDPADFPCPVGTVGPSNEAEPSASDDPDRYPEEHNRIANLTHRLEEQKSDFDRLLAAYLSAGNDWERTRLQMVHLHQDVGATRHLDEHHQEIMDQLSEVYRRFQQARTNVSLAQQAVDDTQAELERLQHGTLSSPSSSSGSDTLLPADEDPGTAELEAKLRAQEEALAHRHRKVARRREKVTISTLRIERLILQETPLPPRTGGDEAAYESARREHAEALEMLHWQRRACIESCARAEAGLVRAQRARDQTRQELDRLRSGEGERSGWGQSSHDEGSMDEID